MTREEAIYVLLDEADFLYGDDSPYIRKAFDMAIEALKAQRWIPCSERLPDNPIGGKNYNYEGEDIAADEYIVMIKDAKIPTSLYWTGNIWFSPYGIDAGSEYSVVAWMPLPEPYREGEE